MTGLNGRLIAGAAVVALGASACGGSSSPKESAGGPSTSGAPSASTSTGSASLPAGCRPWDRTEMGGDPGLVLGSYSNGIGDRAGTKCLATSPGPLVVCSDYRPSGATTAKELHLTFDGQPYTTGKSTTCPAAGGTSVLVLTAGSHVMTIAEDPSYKFTAVIS